MSLPTPQEERYYEQLRTKARERYLKANRASLAYPQVIFIGDSITEFFPLETLLTTTKILANRGISASRTDHILDHLDCHLYGSMLQQVVLLIGVNDLGYGRSQEEILKTLEALILAIQADSPLVRISLLEILPINEQEKFRKTTGLRTNQAIDALNQAYAQLAEAYPMVDLLVTNAFFKDKEGQLAEVYTLDGLHLSPAGYALLAELVDTIL